MSGYVVLLNGGPVATVAREVLYLQLPIDELYEPVNLPTPVYCDNQAAIALASNNKLQSRTKHTDFRYHFVRAHVNNGTFELKYCPSNDNIADALTRPRLQKLLSPDLDSTAPLRP